MTCINQGISLKTGGSQGGKKRGGQAKVVSTSLTRKQ